jgi:hypothetical protein
MAERQTPNLDVRGSSPWWSAKKQQEDIHVPAKEGNKPNEGCPRRCQGRAASYAAGTCWQDHADHSPSDIRNERYGRITRRPAAGKIFDRRIRQQCWLGQALR